MDEHGYVRSVHAKLPDNIYVWKIAKSFNNEVVDAFYAGVNGKILFIEYKFRALPKRPGTQIIPDLSKKQLRWLRNMYGRDISVAVIVGTSEGGVILWHPTEWSWGIPQLEFTQRMQPVKDIAAAIVTELT